MTMRPIGTVFDATAHPPGPRTTQAPRATRSELARARLRAAALLGDPVEVEAAASAYVAAVNLAMLADLGRLMLGKARLACRRIRGHRRTSAGGTERGP